MKSRPEKGNAPVVGATEASSEKSQPTKKGTIEMNSTALTIAGTAVRQMNGLYSLNDLHKVSGGEEKHQPAFFCPSRRNAGVNCRNMLCRFADQRREKQA